METGDDAGAVVDNNPRVFGVQRLCVIAFSFFLPAFFSRLAVCITLKHPDHAGKLIILCCRYVGSEDRGFYLESQVIVFASLFRELHTT